MQVFRKQTAYRDFAFSVTRRARYVFESEAEEFLSAVMATIGDRTFVVDPDSTLCRAQLGHRWQVEKVAPDNPDSDTVEVECAYDIERMKPLRDSAREGRINAKGIPCLYLCDDETTAMSETRPWIGSYVSLGSFVVLKKLTVVNCCDRRVGITLLFKPPFIARVAPEKCERIVWGEISHAFSEPVNPTDMTAEYAPTQILSDLFRTHGYDGIRYKGLLGPGFNYALFDLDAADLYTRALHKVKNVSFEFDLEGNSYVNRKYYKADSSS